MDAEHLKQKLTTPGAGSHYAAVLVPLLRTSNGLEILLEERSARLRTQPGEVCLPGGGVEKGETLAQTALRESLEETGLPPERVQILGQLPAQAALSGRLVWPLVGLVDGVDFADLCPSSDEVAQLFTVPLDWLADNPPERCRYDVVAQNYGQMPEKLWSLLEQHSRSMMHYVWQYQGHVIWGLTARILVDLLAP